MSAIVFVEWNDHGLQRVSFEIGYSPTELTDWFKDDAGFGEAIMEFENDMGFYLEDRLEEGGVGWLITNGGSLESAEKLLSRIREWMRSLRVLGA
jgi:hypothetical protein